MGERQEGASGVDPKKAQRMIDRIIKLEKRNIQTRHLKDQAMVEQIKAIIREEAEAYVD